MFEMTYRVSLIPNMLVKQVHQKSFYTGSYRLANVHIEGTLRTVSRSFQKLQQWPYAMEKMAKNKTEGCKAV